MELNLEHAMSLHRAWERAYDLAEGTLRPPAQISLPPNVPPPPHLEDCSARTAFRESTEKRAANGDSPKWANSSEACGWVPQPPWVRGSDAGNLAATRQAQRDLWERQFPASCKERRLLLIEWSPLERHGLGSQLHIMTALFSLAVSYNRTFVPMPGTYMRANHSECQAIGKAATFECYFFPMVSKECEDMAMEEHKAGRIPPCPDFRGLEGALRSDSPVVCANDEDYNFLRLRSDAAREWDHAFLQRPNVVELTGSMQPVNEVQRQIHWWRAQAIRFMLRWPSAYMCHITNRVRHSAYGLQIAIHLVSAAAEQEAIIRALKPDDAHKGLAINYGQEINTLSHINFSAPNLENEVWPGLDFAGCSLDSHTDPQRPKHAADSVYEGVGGEPYIPRPIVSMHVRQGDKAGEMRLISFPSFMFMANRLRRRIPHLKYVWLSTEMQSVVDQSQQYKDWAFLYSTNPRQNGTTSIFEYEQNAGVAKLAGISLANLLISSQCDFYVGALGSNWNRLINELKATSGRVYSGYASVNFDEW
ncbi:hypothetical protein CLOM_g7996 [Closterium sp. NIES-68]|nr:hypothetical protein CLOM_g7996 [Closterium sp. NIES-68]GJP71670.1 hypothetical protein CLOP_g2482 [Closterium sp. NIES-67]